MTDRTVSRALLDAARAAAVPAGLREAIGGAGTPPAVASGQIWRAAHEHVTVLVLTLTEEVDGDVGVVPLSFDIDESDVPPGAVAAVLGDVLGVPIAALPAFGTRLGVRVLELLLNEGRHAAAVAAELARDGGLPSEGPPAPETALDGWDPFSGSVEAAADLLDALHVLAAAPRVPVSPPGAHRALTERLPGDGAGKISALREVLGIGQPEAMALLQGRRQLTPVQREWLAEHLGGHADPASGNGLPAALAAEVERPRWRPQVRRIAAGDGTDEVTARVALGAGAWALAARDSAAEPNWAERIAAYLRAGP